MKIRPHLAAGLTDLSFLQENVMFEPTRPYEPLTSENAALAWGAATMGKD